MQGWPEIFKNLTYLRDEKVMSLTPSNSRPFISLINFPFVLVLRMSRETRVNLISREGSPLQYLHFNSQLFLLKLLFLSSPIQLKARADGMGRRATVNESFQGSETLISAAKQSQPLFRICDLQPQYSRKPRGQTHFRNHHGKSCWPCAWTAGDRLYY